MNININKINNKTINKSTNTLFESNENLKKIDILKLSPKDLKLDNKDLALINLYKFSSKQFVLKDGTIMGTIAYKELGSMPISLKYHFDKTITEDDFINSVRNFLAIGDKQISNDDEVRLIEHYRKFKNKK